MTKPDISALTCPSCGAAITLLTGAQAQVVVCPRCHAVLDAQDPNLKILQKFDSKTRAWKPVIPLGTKGSLKGEVYQAIGYQVRRITEDGEDYFWREYTLWNPSQGYRYLSEYDGHWNDIVITKNVPTVNMGADPPTAEFHGETFKHFQTANATTVFILGEFPWQVKVGDQASVIDFVSPPHMLSEEKTNEETTWSVGTYTPPGLIWEEFKLPGPPFDPIGIYENQPDNYMAPAVALGQMFFVFIVLLGLFFIGRHLTAPETPIFTDSYQFTPTGHDSAAFVTPIFPITGRTSNVKVDILSSVANSWAYFNLSLINDSTGKAIDFGRETSYYFGSDEDGAWTEGDRRDISFLPAVPPGNYFLRVAPEGPVGGNSVAYSITLTRDVARYVWFLIAFAVLSMWPLFVAIRAWTFESARWKESDHPMVTVSTDDS